MSGRIIALLDLGCAGLGSLAAGAGLLRGQPWARVARYAIVGWYALVSVAVFAMVANDDAMATAPRAALFGLFAAVFCTFAVLLYRPLFSARREGAAMEVNAVIDLPAHVR